MLTQYRAMAKALNLLALPGQKYKSTNADAEARCSALWRQGATGCLCLHGVGWGRGPGVRVRWCYYLNLATN
jgi:hypothetical protein